MPKAYSWIQPAEPFLQPSLPRTCPPATCAQDQAQTSNITPAFTIDSLSSLTIFPKVSLSTPRRVHSIAMYQNSTGEYPCSPGSTLTTATGWSDSREWHHLHNSILLFSPPEQSYNSVSASNACSSVPEAQQKFSRTLVPQLRHELDCPAASTFYSTNILTI